jgi:hypothetical protein
MPFRLGDVLRDASNPSPQLYNAAKAFIANLEAYLDAHGDLPPNEEIVEWMLDERLVEMPELPSRMSAILDERRGERRSIL